MSILLLLVREGSKITYFCMFSCSGDQLHEATVPMGRGHGGILNGCPIGYCCANGGSANQNLGTVIPFLWKKKPGKYEEKWGKVGGGGGGNKILQGQQHNDLDGYCILHRRVHQVGL